MLQITDVSQKIKAAILKGEQHMLQTINATVSHEMRNPINAILCQNLRLEELTDLLQEIIDSENKTTINKIKKKLKDIVDQ